MNAGARRVQRVYLVLLLFHTLAASFIWGINTLFLLDAGLTNAQAFAANAFFTAGLVLFEVPTGLVADMRGRRLSYLLGTLTLAVSTLLYLLMWRITAPFAAWALVSALLGLGFTFFSGAVQAWLVDALHAHGYDGALDPIFARGEIVEGVAMLGGSVLGGYVAQLTNLGVPYVLRAAALAVSFVTALLLMHDTGFTPTRNVGALAQMKAVLRGAIQYGLANPPVRWVMIASAFTDGVSIYGFYAMQPYLLDLYGDPKAYGVAGLSAAIVGGAQIAGGLLVARLSRVVPRRTTLLLFAVVASGLTLGLIGLIPRFPVAVALLVVWGLLFSMVMPVRQAYLNALIPSEQRATGLSFDSLMGSAGGVGAQPLLGKAADVWGYPASYLCCAAIQLMAAPFLFVVRRERRDL
ncbi:MAG TPA: MFS transporter [Gemmatimonadaceae bacterium]